MLPQKISFKVFLSCIALACFSWIGIASAQMALPSPSASPSASTAAPATQNIPSEQMLSIDPRLYTVPSPEMIGGLVFAYNYYDIRDNDVIDDYAKLFACDIFTVAYEDDFKWNQIRESLRKDATLRQEKRDYNMRFIMEGTIMLGRYDFQEKTFPVLEEKKLQNLGVFDFQIRNDNVCDGQQLTTIPLDYEIRVRNSITIKDLKVSKENAKKIIDHALKLKTKSRFVHIRFYITIENIITVLEGDQAGTAQFVANVDEAVLFLDSDFTQPLQRIPVR